MEGCIIRGLGTHLKVADAEKSRKFYESLGFKPVFAYGDKAWQNSFGADVGKADEKYRGVTFKVSDSANFEIAEGHFAIKDKGAFKEIIKSPKISAMVQVDSLVPLLKNKNVKIVFPVRRYYWGTVESAFRDPDGFVLVFIAKATDTELTAVKKLTKVEEVMSNPE